MSGGAGGTPLYDHANLDGSVYEPSEDTFLLLDAISQDLPARCDGHLTMSHDDRGHDCNQGGPYMVMEVGCGTGLPIVHLTLQLQHHLRSSGLPHSSTVSFATDINPAAAATAQKTASLNGVALHVVQTDLVRGLENTLRHRIDFLVFNPPYVVTPTEEITSSVAARAWAGGIDGREVTDRFLPLVDRLLSPRGCCYLLLLDQNQPKEVMALMEERFRLQSGIILSRKAGREKLHIVKFWRKPL